MLALIVLLPAALALTLGGTQPPTQPATTNLVPTGGSAPEPTPAPAPAPDDSQPRTELAIPAAEPTPVQTEDADAAAPLASPASGFGAAPRPTSRSRTTPPEAGYLEYQYSIGSESDARYRKNPDLDKTLKDNSLTVAPQVNGHILYRPNADTEMMLEMILEREMPWREENLVVLPGGGLETPQPRHSSLAIDQLFVSFKRLGPSDLTVGRRNFEDDRHWLYDTSLDGAHARIRQGDFRTDISLTRKDWFNGDLLQSVPRGRINNYMAYTEYRGIEDHKLAAYLIRRDDKAGVDGDPLHLGLRTYGNPSDAQSYWAELGLVRGRDEAGNKLRGHAVDLGATYRWRDLPMRPSAHLGYAFGSGDGNAGDNVNKEFRQTGLHSNEIPLTGVAKFKYYGEALDPDLSNLRVLTAAVGFRPAGTVSVDVVWHKYTTQYPADQIRNAALTAQMNQDDSQAPSRDVGQAIDVVVGLRQLFGIRKFGLDLRAGWFLPGKAYRNEILSGPNQGNFHKSNKSLGLVFKIWL